MRAQALGAGMFVPRGGPRFTLPSEGISNFLRRGYEGQSELVGGWVGSLLHAAGNIRGYSKPPKWGGRGEFAVRTPPGRPLPQSQRGDEGEQSLTLQRPQARPARFLPKGGTDTRALSLQTRRRARGLKRSAPRCSSPRAGPNRSQGMATPPAATTPPCIPNAQPCCALRPVPGLRRHSTASARVL